MADLQRRLALANGEPTPKHHRTGNLDGMGYNRAELDHAGMRRDRLYYIFNSVVYMRPPVSGGLFRGQQYVDGNDG
jgi:hypothetical protein